MTEDVRGTLQQLLASELKWDGPAPTGELAEHFDSVERLTLVVAIEDHFEISFDPEDEDQVSTLDDVVSIVQKKLETRDA